jgi:hypothetical protein
MNINKFLNSKYLIIFLFVLISSISAHSIQLGQITIKTNDSDSLIARFLAQSVHDNQKRMEEFFRSRISSPVNILLSSSVSDYRKSTGLQIPEWSAAVALPDRRLIILKPADYFDPESYTTSLLHELAHIYLADKLRDNSIPLWINEGVAMYLSKKTLNWNENTIAGNAVVGNNLLSFYEIDELIKFKAGLAQIAYIQSFLSIQYFLKQYGEEELKNMLDSAAKGIEVRDYIKLQLGLEYEDLEYNSIEWIKDKYWWMIFLQFENLIWISMPVLALLVIIVIKIRNRRKLSEWTKEEMLTRED